MDFLVGGGSVLEILGMETKVLSESDASSGKQIWPGLSERVEGEEEG